MAGHSLQSKKHIDWKTFLPRHYSRISEAKHPVANLSKRDIGLLIVIDCNTAKPRIPRRDLNDASMAQGLGPINFESALNPFLISVR